MIDEIMWCVYANFVKDDNGNNHLEYGKPVIKLEWGWDAGLSEEQLKRKAEDSPKGKDWVFLHLDDAKALRNRLNELLKTYDS